MSEHYNKNHGYDEDEVKQHIRDWNKSQQHGEDMKKIIEENLEKMIGSRKKVRDWKNKNVDSEKMRKYNLARNRMMNGLTQFFDGVGDLLDIENSNILNSDFMNIMAMTAFAKSTAFEKIRHWAKAEKEVQLSKNVELPGSTSKQGGKEKVGRPEEMEEVWYGLQFMYRQFEIFRYVPNYDIVSSIWNLVANEDRQVVHILDHWYYLHNAELKERTQMSDVTKGYFFRYNAKMTSHAQAETLFILNCLFNHSGSKPMGTLERPPWFDDSVICGNDGNLPFSTNVTTQNIDNRKKKQLDAAPIIGKTMDGIRTMPSECEDPDDFEDKEISKCVTKKYKNKKEMVEDVKKNEKKRGGRRGYFKGKDGFIDQHWDQDAEKSYDEGVEIPDGANVTDDKERLNEKVLKRGQGTVYYDGDHIVRKIVDEDGNSVTKLITDRDRKYKVGREI